MMAVEVADESLSESQLKLLEQIGALEHQFLRGLMEKSDRTEKINKLAIELERGVKEETPRINFLRRKVREQLLTAYQEYQRERRDSIRGS